MLKKQTLIICTAILLLFLFMNWNYLPGSNAWYLSTWRDIILMVVFGLTAVLFPFAVIFFFIDLSNIYRNKSIRVGIAVDLALSLLFVLQLYVLEPVMEDWSRSRAIHKAAPLIHDVETFKKQHGIYPAYIDLSIYPTGCIAYKNYSYLNNINSYSLQFLGSGGEVIFYSPDGNYITDMEVHAASQKGWYYYYDEMD